MMADWYFLTLRAVICLAATYMGVNLLWAFALNHYLHKPKRWLVGWQGLFFLGVGLDAMIRLSSRAHFIFTGQFQDVTTWPYFTAGGMMALGAAGTLLVWLRWPQSRTVGGQPDRRKDDA
jgi:hypothetical protein